MKEKEEEEMTRACCRPEGDTQMHRDLILEFCEQMNKKRSVKEKEMRIRESVSGMKSNV